MLAEIATFIYYKDGKTSQKRCMMAAKKKKKKPMVCDFC